MTRAAARLGLFAAAAVAGAYLLQLPQTLPVTGLLAAAAFEGFHDAEDGYRWSADRARLRFRDPGPGVPFRVELDLSAWRPRGQAPPRVTLSAGRAARHAHVSARRQTLAVDASTAGWWRSDVIVHLDAETFRPGPSDARRLGARLHGARLVPRDGVVGWRRPPVGQVIAVAGATVLAFLALVRLGVASRAAERATRALPLAMGLALVVARPWAVAVSWALAWAASVAATAAFTVPGAVRAFPAFLAEAGRALGRGARVWRARPAATLVAAVALAVAAAYRAQPPLDVDLGSGAETPVIRGFGASDGEGGVTFRRALRGAELDLRDFGGGGTWTIAVRSSTAGPPRAAVLARAGTAELRGPVDGQWATRAFEAPAPWGWRSGLSVTFPAADVRLDRVAVDRGRNWPPLRVVAAVVASSLLIGAAAGAVGVSRVTAWVAAALAVLGSAFALALAPMGSIPFATPWAAICLAGALWAAVLGAAARFRAAAAPPLPPPTLLAATLGFVAWLAAATFPLYRGGHFVFHSQIAEEIWRGRFLLFYLPYPGSILSRQEQWGDVIVPHPCLYHTLVAPLAALPRPYFHAVEKGILALALASLLLLAARLAQRFEGDRAAVWAAIVFASLAPTFQVLGLGHLMMLFGVWAASMALGFVLLRFDDLPRPAPWLSAVLLLTLCFLSYTASLLFTAMVVGAATALLARRAPAPARALFFAAIGAAALAFGLYYVNWAWPFLSESLPHIVSSTPGAGGGDTWSRLLLQPGKLTYTYGSVLVPLLGLGGLLLLRPSAPGARVLLLCWALVLVLVGGMDVFFNFLRKHHYYVLVPLAVGGGILLSRLAARGRAGRIAAAVLCLASAALGLRTALDVALGKIP